MDATPDSSLFPLRPLLPGRKLLILLNGGRQSRNWLLGLGAGAKAAGISYLFVELDQIWAAVQGNKAAAMQQIESIFISQKIGAFLGYAMNGAAELPQAAEQLGLWRGFLEMHQVPHLMLWADHPQWAANKQGLAPGVQAIFRSGNVHHFVKSEAHAEELRRVLGWPNCHELPLSADVEVLQPAKNDSPDFDVVSIYGNDLPLQDWMKSFLEQDDPNPREMGAVVAKDVSKQLADLWTSDAPVEMRPQLTALGERLIGLKISDPTAATARFLPLMNDEFPQAVWWLTAKYPTYFKMAAILWALRIWQRIFYPAYLAKYFKVAVFGSTGGSPGVTGSPWIDFKDMPAAFARGKIAMNIISGWDEEGLTAKTFEIAACGMPMVHNRCRGLAENFAPGREVEIFDTPKEAREIIQSLLADEPRRASMAVAIRDRLVNDHTWASRLKQMFAQARLPVDAFNVRT